MDVLGVLGFVGAVIVGLLLLVFLVVVHELGHAIAARRNGVVVEEFGIGFPPRAWSKKLKNGVLFTLNWLPLGGFVKLQGENDAAKGKGDYGAASYWVKTKILLAGVGINWLVAALLFTILALVGLPKILPDQFQVAGDSTTVLRPVAVASVTEGSPADEAGIERGDELLRFDGQPIQTPQNLVSAAEANKGETVEVIYNRGGSESITSVTLNKENNGQGYLGIGPSQQTLLKSTWSAPIVGIVTTAQFSWETLKGLGTILVNLVTGVVSQLNFNPEVREQGSAQIDEISQGVAGPIGILGIVFPSAVEAGVVPLLLITAIISLTLAIMNTLPIPALDGGRFFLMTLFKILKKPLTKEREENINAIGFLSLMALVVLVTVSDVSKLF